MIGWLSNLTTLPPDALKAIGTVLVGGLLALGTYVIARIKEARKPADAVAAGMPRISLSPEDRDLAYLLARTGTDLTRALHDHGELLRNGGCGGGGGGPAPAPQRQRRVTRPRTERPEP